jgi:hypothetical protein
VKAGDPPIALCLAATEGDDDMREDPVKAETERIGFARRAVAQMAAMRQVLAMILGPDFVMEKWSTFVRTVDDCCLLIEFMNISTRGEE